MSPQVIHNAECNEVHHVLRIYYTKYHRKRWHDVHAIGVHDVYFARIAAKYIKIGLLTKSYLWLPLPGS